MEFVLPSVIQYRSRLIYLINFKKIVLPILPYFHFINSTGLYLLLSIFYEQNINYPLFKNFVTFFIP